MWDYKAVLFGWTIFWNIYLKLYLIINCILTYILTYQVIELENYPSLFYFTNRTNIFSYNDTIAAMFRTGCIRFRGPFQRAGTRSIRDKTLQDARYDKTRMCKPQRTVGWKDEAWCWDPKLTRTIPTFRETIRHKWRYLYLRIWD